MGELGIILFWVILLWIIFLVKNGTTELRELTLFKLAVFIFLTWSLNVLFKAVLISQSTNEVIEPSAALLIAILGK